MKSKGYNPPPKDHNIEGMIITPPPPPKRIIAEDFKWVYVLKEYIVRKRPTSI